MPGLIPPAKLDEIRAANDIVDVIGGYLGPLKRAGGNFVTLCPFHREKSPSFSVSAARQYFHCFGCNKGGDVFTFVKEYENLSFIEAVRRLADRGRIVLEFEDNPHAQQQRGEKESLLLIHEEICKRWQTALANDPAGQIARDYLAQRRVSAEAVKLFRLGYAPDLWDDTVNWAKSKPFDLALVERGGLIIRKEGSDRHYDRFRGRLMFPICDEQGRVIGFSGRILLGDEKSAKYVNSPETPIFTKGRVIFGLDKSKRALADRDCAIICEGQLDLIACFMADVKNVVAPQGTALTADHCRILKRYADEVVLCFDSDNAGQNAAVRSLDLLLASGLAIRVATLPAPHDPDTFIKAHGGPAFAQLIDQAEGFFDYLLNRLCATNDITSDKGRTAVLKAMAEATQKTRDAVTVDKYAQKTAARLGVAPESMRAEFKKIGPPKPPVARPAHPDDPPDDYYDTQAGSDTSPGGPVAEPPPSKQEFWLLQALFHSDDQIDWLANHLRLEWITHFGVRQILSLRLTAFANQSSPSFSQLLGDLPDDATRALCTLALAESDRMLASPLAPEGADPARAARISAERARARLAMLRDVLTRLRNDHLDRRMVELNRDLNAPNTTEAQLNELLRERAQLRLQKQQPLPG